ncbi:hypothetical protein SKA34_11190 [Photobacterium sp. SKA34]|nr:hypothetical protein SKA34_11190 [Photobacterium sp. SKA34]
MIDAANELVGLIWIKKEMAYKSHLLKVFKLRQIT